MLNYIETKSEKEVIEILENHGIRVVYKPVALLPDNMHDFHRIGMTPHGFIETDIYEVLNKLEIIKQITPDPFSKK